MRRHFRQLDLIVIILNQPLEERKQGFFFGRQPAISRLPVEAFHSLDVAVELLVSFNKLGQALSEQFPVSDRAELHYGHLVFHTSLSYSS